jgi:Beta-ketoacyl synthase, N-terminal domain
MNVSIQGIGLLAAGLEGWRAGRAVLAGTEPFVPAAVLDPEAALLPPNERRRSSDCVRWAVHVAQEAITHSGLDPREVSTVFASSGGETGALNAICRILATTDRVISPTLFHQSVHNTAAGYWSIATACQQSSTALSCYDDSFAAGLLEAITLVCMEQCPVLLVAYDLAVPAPLNEARPITTGLAVAFVLVPPSNCSLSGVRLSLDEAHQDGPTVLVDPALERVRQDNPAARSLPLLSAIAAGRPQSVRLSLLDSQQLFLEIDPCRS